MKKSNLVSNPFFVLPVVLAMGCSDSNPNQSDKQDGGIVEDTNGDEQWDTSTFEAKDTEWNTDFDTSIDETIPGCELPSDFLTPPDVPSYLMFTANGVIEDLGTTSPSPIQASYQTKLQNEFIGLGSEHSEMLLSMSGGHHIVIKAFGNTNPAGMLRYAEIDVDVGDIVNLQGPRLDMWASDDIVSNLTLYDAVMNGDGQLVKLCQTAAVGESGEFYLCNTNIDYTNNVGQTFGIAGNIVLYDDTEYMERAQGIRCVCDNGAGDWRNCDEGVPDAYGLLKFNFKVGMGDDEWFSKYVYNEETLYNSSKINTDYVYKHPEGIWQTYYAAILGGINIGAVGTDPSDGTSIYRFRTLLTPQDNVTVTALVSKDTSKDRLVLRQQSFDATSEAPVGYWINAYIPPNVTTGDQVSFGSGTDRAKLFVFDPNDPSNCILAIACAGEVAVETAENLDLAEGGSLYLKTNANSSNTRQTVELFHPTATPTDCDWTTYLNEAGQPSHSAICDKI